MLEDSLKPANCPFKLLNEWLELAKKSYDQANFPNYNAAVLSTVNEAQQVSSRVILIKQITEDGLIFFTNTKSKKAQQIQLNNKVSLLFFWANLGKQIRIEGKACRVDDNIAIKYFVTRPHESNLASVASKQSQSLASLDVLYKEIYALKQQHPDTINKPEYWVGYKVIPHYFEFWSEGEYRVHTRITYTKTTQENVVMYKENLLYP